MTYSEHMVQHLVLAQLVPLVLAAWRPRRWHPHAGIAWITGIMIMIGTSVPPVHSLARQSAALEWAIRIALVAAGFLFWSPVFGSARVRLGAGAAVVYLVTACFATTLAGAYIAFSATTTDQQVAGLIMWVPCCIVFLGASLTTVVRAMRGTSSVARQHAN